MTAATATASTSTRRDGRLVWGAVLGGIVLGLINAFSDRYISAQWTNAIVFGVLIGILVFRPTGLLGQQLAHRV